MSQLRTVVLHMLTPAMITIGVAISATNNIEAQQPTQKSLADSLVDAAQQHQSRVEKSQQEESSIQREIDDEQSNLRSAESDLTSLQEKQPALKQTWKYLEIGEFERQSDFERRRNKVQAEEQRAFASAESEWRRTLSSRENEVRILRAATEQRRKELRGAAQTANEKTASAAWEEPSLPFVTHTLTSKQLSLPRFNRETLSFEPVVIEPFGSTELQSLREGNLVARIEESNKLSVRIKLPSLESAQSFRERFEGGEITCVVVGGLDFVRAESPILVQSEITKEEETYVTKGNAGRTIGAFAIGILAAAIGASPDQMQQIGGQMGSDPNWRMQPTKQKVVVQSEKKVDGTRFHFQMSQEAVSFIDKEQKTVMDASVVILNDFVLVKKIMSDAQHVSRALQPGDRIVRVGDHETRDVRALASAVRPDPVAHHGGSRTNCQSERPYSDASHKRSRTLRSVLPLVGDPAQGSTAQPLSTSGVGTVRGGSGGHSGRRRPADGPRAHLSSRAIF